MARKAIVDKDKILNMLKEGKTTQSIAEMFDVSRQAIDLHRRDFISRSLLHDQRAARIKRAEKEAGRTAHKIGSLDEQIDLIIAAFSALKRLPELEKELEMYKRKYENATKETEFLQEAEHKRRHQELQWLLTQPERDKNTSP